MCLCNTHVTPVCLHIEKKDKTTQWFQMPTLILSEEVIHVCVA